MFKDEKPKEFTEATTDQIEKKISHLVEAAKEVKELQGEQ
jgi:hypothetical protein